jgi:aspartyl-tRNA(Asn)/glutamyl-tRNA(Gln) amidotransferase subunit A
VRYGLRVDADDVTAMNEATRTPGFGAEVKRRIMLGTYALSAGYYDAYYGQALKVRTQMIDAFARAYDQADLLLGATTPSVAFEFGEKTSNPMAMYLSDVFTIPSNLSGEPAISVPSAPVRPICPWACNCSDPVAARRNSSPPLGCSRLRTDRS